MLSYLGLFAMQYVNIQYLWGGDNPLKGYDCSGLVQDIVASVGLDPVGDQTAQGLYDYYSKQNFESCTPGMDCILFYGRSIDHISHVALGLNDKILIEAGGGNSHTTDLETAREQRAYVRLRPINRRKDLVASIKLKYNISDYVWEN